MALLRIHSWLAGMALWALPFLVHAQVTENTYIPQKDIFLLQPFTALATITNDGTINVVFVYFKEVWPWLFGSAAGVAVIWAMVAGVMIMMSGENSTLRDKGKGHLKAVMIGLVMIALSGLILTTLNSIFYT